MSRYTASCPTNKKAPVPTPGGAGSAQGQGTRLSGRKLSKVLPGSKLGRRGRTCRSGLRTSDLLRSPPARCALRADALRLLGATTARSSIWVVFSSFRRSFEGADEVLDA